MHPTETRYYGISKTAEFVSENRVPSRDTQQLWNKHYKTGTKVAAGLAIYDKHIFCVAWE